jgi:hypothetical protein
MRIEEKDMKCINIRIPFLKNLMHSESVTYLKYWKENIVILAPSHVMKNVRGEDSNMKERSKKTV